METLSLDNSSLELIKNLIYQKLGIHIPEEKESLLFHKINRLLVKENYNNFFEFYNSLKNGDTNKLEELIKYVTTTHTFFFRERSHFTFLVHDIKKNYKNNTLIWVAASSTGEEVYSIIMELLEHHINHFSIMATDVNKDVLITLKKGIYAKEKLAGVPPQWLSKYFNADEDNQFFQVKRHLKNFFIVKKLNLVEPIHFEHKFDYIFCRNVMIYFDKITQRKVVINLLKNLKPDGKLFTGHSESLFYLNDLLKSTGDAVYRKV